VEGLADRLVRGTVEVAREWLRRRPEFGPRRPELVVADLEGSWFTPLLKTLLPEALVLEGEVRGVPRPALELGGSGEGTAVYAGYPLLHELEAFLVAAWDRSLERGAAATVLSLLEERGFPAEPEGAEREAYLLVTPECPYCPRVAFALASASRVVPGARYFIVDAYDDALLELFAELSGVEGASAVPLLAAGDAAYVGAPRGGVAAAVAYVLAALRAVDADPAEAARSVKE